MKKSSIKATEQERSKMDDTDKKQQDAIEYLSERIDSLILAILFMSVIWLGTVLLTLFFPTNQ